MIGSNITYSASPANAGQVINQADGLLWGGLGDSSPSGYTHRVNMGNSLGWSSTATPTNTPYAGAPGCIQIYGNNQGVSATAALALIMATYEFRSRS